ncbi:hypothetical protein EVG20_g3301 [Dentipellis fragilis]|uniref:15-cis-phytoene synthase n=1 Tax=Dentipellis fragilis TaxID=205917 RepID=A0A4Y9Z6S7_9AGAM|nr:hypothetical protein EVG20_g3301 [Dentipellis fragilis]
MNVCSTSVRAPTLAARTLTARCKRLSPASFRYASSTTHDHEGHEDPYTYCRNLVQKRDYEGFLVSQLCPKDKIGGYFALRAFYTELAGLPESVSNVMIGKMRLQFWRDAIRGIADVSQGRPPHHPIALALSDTAQRANLPSYHLRRIVDARESELENPTYLTMDSLTSHAESTSSTMFYLLLSLLNLSSDTCSHAASHLGVAQGLTTLLRALPYHVSKGRMIVPAEITAKHGVNQEEVFRKGPNVEGIEDAVFEFATVANDHLITAREMFKETDGRVPRVAMPVFAAGLPVASYLKRLEEVNFDVFHPSLQLRDWKLPWRVWRSYYKSRAQEAVPALWIACVVSGLSLAAAPSTYAPLHRFLHPDEILQLIFNELDRPIFFTQTSRRYHEFSQDPYVRANYFLSRYGPIEALYWALGRGKLVNHKVIDILLSSGAHLSRYLIQLALHHYFRSSVPFIKTQWVRTVSFTDFTYLLNVAGERLGEIPVGKGDDDGTVFMNFIKENRVPPNLRSVKTETVIELFIPFCKKVRGFACRGLVTNAINVLQDPIMVQFPLALAVEPRLLPPAVGNGFRMDSRYRDFVFRRMFEKSNGAAQRSADDIIRNVCELCRLESTMFVSRTVAAEVCMEAHVNEVAYSALKSLNRKGVLRFDLASVVEDLIELFIKTRSLTSASTTNALRQLYFDFPSKSPTARLVMLLTIFINGSGLDPTVETLHSKLEALRLTPLGRRDIFNMLLNPFLERYSPVMNYAKAQNIIPATAVNDFLLEVASKSLEVACKGKMLQRMVIDHQWLENAILKIVVSQYQLDLDDLPPQDDENACRTYEAKLARDLNMSKYANEVEYSVESANDDMEDENEDEDQLHDDDDSAASAVAPIAPDSHGLGHIGQETLSYMIRQDDLTPARRRRLYPYNPDIPQFMTTLPYPHDSLQISRWVHAHFGRRHPITAVFMTHTLINETSGVLGTYLQGSNPVPVTLKHFKLLAHLGRAPTLSMWLTIRNGAEFFFTDEDYLSKQVKKENTPSADVVPPSSATSSHASEVTVTSTSWTPAAASPSKRRPRRSAATHVKSYAVPDSDDDAITGEKPDLGAESKVRKRKVESSLQRWIKHLQVLLREEQKKYNEKKRRMEKMSPPPGMRMRVPKSEFLKSLQSNLRDLRKTDQEKRQQLYGPDVADEDYSEGEDDEYHYRTKRVKRRKTNVSAE